MSESDYITTTSHSFVSRSAALNTQTVQLKGRVIVEPHCQLHAPMVVNRYCFIGSQTIFPVNNNTLPLMTIGAHSCIGTGCVIEAASIGMYCWIGNNAKLGKRVIIKDCCVIADNTVIGDDTVVPPFTRIAFRNHDDESNKWTMDHCTELPPSTAMILQERSMERYQDFASRLQ